MNRLQQRYLNRLARYQLN